MLRALTAVGSEARAPHGPPEVAAGGIPIHQALRLAATRETTPQAAIAMETLMSAVRQPPRCSEASRVEIEGAVGNFRSTSGRRASWLVSLPNGRTGSGSAPCSAKRSSCSAWPRGGVASNGSDWLHVSMASDGSDWLFVGVDSSCSDWPLVGVTSAACPSWRSSWPSEVEPVPVLASSQPASETHSALQGVGSRVAAVKAMGKRSAATEALGQVASTTVLACDGRLGA
mmetsp:Transcript_49944/g.139893  ORF Transcript_49944/g.139893 Transcript_49944/m.139893 type:complete len:229 (+) Transcript_49944:152-838(+)